MKNEFVRIVEDGRVSVGGSVGHRDGLLRTDSASMELHLSTGRATEATVRNIHADEFLDCGRNKRRVVAELLLERFVIGKMIAHASNKQWWCDHTNNQRLPQCATRRPPC